jgi:hypothetical protein
MDIFSSCSRLILSGPEGGCDGKGGKIHCNEPDCTAFLYTALFQLLCSRSEARAKAGTDVSTRHCFQTGCHYYRKTDSDCKIVFCFYIIIPFASDCHLSRKIDGYGKTVFHVFVVVSLRVSCRHHRETDKVLFGMMDGFSSSYAAKTLPEVSK